MRLETAPKWVQVKAKGLKRTRYRDARAEEKQGEQQQKLPGRRRRGECPWEVDKEDGETVTVSKLSGMTRNPIYDYPEPYANPRREVSVSARNISLVGRLRLTQPVWLQLGINSATALHILQREPPGTFLVRRSNTWQCQVLCLRLPDISSPAFVTTYCLRQDRAVTWLDGSDLTFPSLLHLIASYCSIPDILPLPLRLPRPIWEASSCQQLEALAHLGLEFWNSSLNNAKEFDTPVPPALPSGVDAVFPLDLGVDAQAQPAESAGGEPTKAPKPSPSEPLPGDVGVRRQYFKNHIKVQVSTEAASPLSPPAAPPPPIPVGKKMMKKNPPQQPAERSQSSNPGPLPGVPSSLATMRLGDYCVPQSKERVPGGHSGATLSPLSSPDQVRQVMEEKLPETKRNLASALTPVPSAPDASTRQQMVQFWEAHSRGSSLQEMMLDSGAQQLSEQDTPEILSLLPRLEGQDVLELGAGIGRFTRHLAEAAHHVTAVDFMESFLKQNQQENGHRPNIAFQQADVTSLLLPSQSFDLIFSNWLFMYLSDSELKDVIQKMLVWLRPGGHLFFRESCFCQSGDHPRPFNPTRYRSPADYNRLLTPAHVACGDELYGFEIVMSRSVQTYVKRKQNRNQVCWLLQKVPRHPEKTKGYDTFQTFLDNEQYAARSIRRYEWIFGPGFVSTGGLSTTKELVSLLDLKPSQRVLDVGCGLGGSDFYMAKEYGVEVLGMDLSRNMVELALERAQKEPGSLVQFEIGNATRRTFPEGSFDIIYSRDTILHVEGKSTLFGRFLSWLKPGGQLLISDYCCGPRPWSKMFTDYVQQRGYSLLTPHEYGQMLKDTGFVQVQALDRTGRMVSALTQELQQLERSRKEFVQVGWV
ncbi:hypothetical protein JRQ81_009476 [Phrynocephalus forsythii]|uniref:phosphoethanolamine N-methyltransferase n=1 Tax=Phrynocephalus forsythii TaxID=171643 RepID=A0A9Q0XAC6_9SAUR|nr:hypothetical protein JRQ81_009476 [Phrynocephalus forsythii]